jgi:hypothetical protein
MADPTGVLAQLKAISDSYGQQINALQQPAPRQGGILSNADPVMLSLAAGLLSPTKTGGFGESVGLGLQAASGPLSEMRKQEAARLDKMQALQEAQARLNLDIYRAQTGATRGYKPDDPLLRYNRYIEGRAAAEASLQNAIDTKDQAAIDRWTKSIQNLDAEAESIFGANAVERVKGRGDAGAGDENPGALPIPKTQEEYDALPIGSAYIDDETGEPKRKTAGGSEQE